MDFLPGIQSLKNLHPLFVHFPIALILTALLFEAMWWFSNNEKFRDFATYLLILSAFSVIFAVSSGYIASNTLGHETPEHDFVHQHRDIMLWMSAILLFTVLMLVIIPSIRIGPWRKLIIIPLLIINALLIYGADKGGRLVFEFSLGVQAAREKLLERPAGHEEDFQQGDTEKNPAKKDSTKSPNKNGEPGH